MLTEIAKQHGYQEAFRTLQESRHDATASWVERLRENAMATFTELGFPSVKEEEWKYTNVAAIARTDFTPLISADDSRVKSAASRLSDLGYVEAQSSQLVFVNGILRRELSSLA